MATTTTKKKPIKSSLSKRRIQSFMRDKMAVVCFFGMMIMILMCICAPLLTPYDPGKIVLADRNLPMSAEHPFGTDMMGRDVFARILYGGRYSIAIGLIGALCTNTVGAVLGCIAGFFGGVVDKVIVTVQEYLSFFPQILTIMLFVGVFGGASISLLIVIWASTGWGGLMRIVRARIMSLKQEPYIESCRANGIGKASIMFHHMLPNTLGPVIINVVGAISGYILQEAALAYLGLGLPASVPTWGNIINAAKNLTVVQQHPVLWLAPGIAISLFSLCASFFGNGLRDALDPTSR